MPYSFVKLSWILGLIGFGVISTQAQDVIKLRNPSFEGLPHKGQNPDQHPFSHNLRIYGNSQYGEVNPHSPIPEWTDCGFKRETPPDLHGTNTNFFDVMGQPYDGNSFMGMVVRYNETYERISQRLSQPLEAGKCYKFSIYLARNLYYKSPTAISRDVRQSFSKPCVLRILAGNGFCATKEVLGESVAVENTDWRRYDFVFKPKREWNYIELQAFYKTPVLFPYNGNILLDAASEIVEIPCPQEPILAASPRAPEGKEEERKMALNQDPSGELQKKLDERIAEAKRLDELEKRASEPEVAQNTPNSSSTAPSGHKPKILKELDADKIEEGQVIQIEKLYFDADKADVKSQSYAVLDEVFDFLEKNPRVTVEIGGHTNSKPKHEYCDRLSLSRAQSVAQYLIERGIDSERIISKGYGKRKPIDTRSNHYAHQRNQRVEIRILSIGSKNG